MGPDTSADFIAKLVAATPGEVDADHIRLLVDHNPLVPSRQAALLGDGASPAPTLAAMARGLESAGAELLVMPCNTAHAFADAITAAVDVPFISIIDVTVAACRGFSSVGLIATRGCLECGVYDNAFADSGTDVVHLTAGGVEEFTRLLAEIKAGKRGGGIADAMRQLAVALVGRGAQAIVAGCTEIPLVLDASMLDVPLLSSTDLLAEATVLHARK